MSTQLAPSTRPPRHLQPRSRTEMGFVSLVGLTGLAFVTAGTMIVLPGWLGLAGAAGTFFAFTAWARRRHTLAHALVRQNEEAVALLHGGRIREAVHMLDGLSSQARGFPVLHALFVYNRAVGMMRMGDHAGALTLLEVVRETRWLNSTRYSYREMVAVAFAQAWWALGDLRLAEEWLGTARATITPARRGYLVVVEALVAAAHGRWHDCLYGLRQGAGDVEAVLPASQLRTLRVLEALAVSKLAPPHDAAVEVARLLAGVGRLQAWDLVGVRSVWPEFDAFCRYHGLNAPPETPSV